MRCCQSFGNPVTLQIFSRGSGSFVSPMGLSLLLIRLVDVLAVWLCMKSRYLASYRF